MSDATTLAMPDKSATTITQAVKKYGNKLLSFIKGRAKSLEDAEDILQDVWYQFSNLTNINEIENISGWLYFVARNKITDSYRKKKPLSLEGMSYENDEDDFSIKDVLLLDDSNNPELAYYKEIFWKELMAALNELPENQKQVFILNEIEDKTLQQIADLQGENIKTVISRKGYAVKQLRKKLQHFYEELYS
jgi:RNA polymerase sigma factor (sigma-70 family)